VEALPDLAAELERRGLAAGEELVVRRTIARSGRGRARIGGELVPAATLAELFEGRLEISSQHESQSLPAGAQSAARCGGGLGDRAALEARSRLGSTARSSCARAGAPARGLPKLGEGSKPRSAGQFGAPRQRGRLATPGG
jgi:hypothetical protein